MIHLCSNNIVVEILSIVWMENLEIEGEGWWVWFVEGTVFCAI
jgi:hypothetical protein